VWPSYKKISKFEHEGVPETVITTSMGETVYDHKAKDNFLYARLQELMASVEAAGHQANREHTPAEIENMQREFAEREREQKTAFAQAAIEEEVPFL